MPVTVKIDDKARPKTRRSPKVGPEASGFDAYVLPDEIKFGRIALALWIGIMVVLCLPWPFLEATKTFAYVMPIWCLSASLGILFALPYDTARQLKNAGKEAIISPSNQGAIKTLLGKASKILGIDEPNAFLEEKPLPRVRVLPNDILLHKYTLTYLDNHEISALVVRCLVHLRQGHARRLALLDFVQMAPSKALLFFAWPVLIYASLLRALWLPLARQNADRLSLFLVRNHDLMLGAIMKEYAAHSGAMQELDVSAADVDVWIAQRGHIGGSGEEISTQYKLGRAIHEDLPLEDRLQKLQEWSQSSEFKTGLEKLKSNR